MCLFYDVVYSFNNFAKLRLIFQIYTTMKKILFLLFASLCLFCYADPDEIVLNNNGSGDNRGNFPPTVLHDNETQEIIIQGNYFVSYYDVVISSATTGAVEVSTTVNGTYDTFDVSSLSAGSHAISITSPFGDVYEGSFTTY